jgi:hypothetical protein
MLLKSQTFVARKIEQRCGGYDISVLLLVLGLKGDETVSEPFFRAFKLVSSPISLEY